MSARSSWYEDQDSCGTSSETMQTGIPSEFREHDRQERESEAEALS